ncbi:adenine phosphoribosyltransferase [Sorangium cellulosum]|uniref:Adenine phosphoribosyltransferase n=1 Tax=Sorangium cellulosum TaxID=56 RepID=A0A4P2PZ64_SORCE|nr:adenine phosphoribosyltransferase [Sorangium cellulosum]AUX22194.1 adenine phosphoribosyltransferase [Sorangium cellulosum]
MVNHDDLPSEHALRYLKSHLRNVPDFPRPGILFKDITPLLADPRALHITLDLLAQRYIGEHIDVVVGVESRGFIFGGALSARLNASFVPVRKPGKLPAASDRVAYELEYGRAELEMHKGSIRPGAKVLIVDDLLATGGTAAAAAELARLQGGVIAGLAFVIELDFLSGRALLAQRIGDAARVYSIVRFAAGE